jgi:hypothetical protein
MTLGLANHQPWRQHRSRQPKRSQQKCQPSLHPLYLTVSPAVYANLLAAPFVPPANPGPTPIIPECAQGPQIPNIRTEFVEATELFRHYTTTDKALKQLLVGAVDEMYIRRLQTKYLGYLNVSTQQILYHLYAQYVLDEHDNLNKENPRNKEPGCIYTIEY